MSKEYQESLVESDDVIAVGDASRSDGLTSSFSFGYSFLHELQIMVSMLIKIAIMQNLQMLPQIIGNMFIGHLQNSDTALLLSSVGLAQNFANITGISGILSFIYIWIHI